MKETEGLRRETEKLKKLADEGGRKVKELGNVQNWAELLERDFLVLEETLRLVEEKSDSEWSTESESGSESGDEGLGKEENVEKKDTEGDTEMGGVGEDVMGKGKGKGRETVEVVEHLEVPGGSSTATGSASDPDPSSGSASASIAS